MGRAPVDPAIEDELLAVRSVASASGPRPSTVLMVDGGLAVIANLIRAALDLIVGVVLVASPDIALGTAAVIVATWLLIRGAVEFAAGFALRRVERA